MALTIKDFKVYMPAKDFEKSKRFYTTLGFTMSEGWGGTADSELNGHCSGSRVEGVASSKVGVYVALKKRIRAAPLSGEPPAPYWIT